MKSNLEADHFSIFELGRTKKRDLYIIFIYIIIYINIKVIVNFFSRNDEVKCECVRALGC